MLTVNCITLLVSCIHVGQAVSELVWLEDLNNDHHQRHLEMGLPNHLEFNLKRESGNELKLRLQENVRLNANAPVYEVITENGKQKARELDVPLLDSKFYHDKATGTAVKIQCKKQPYGACKRELEGSLSIDGEHYEIKPSPNMLTARDMGSQTDVPHLIVKVEQQPEPQPDDNIQGLYRLVNAKRNISAELPDDIIADPGYGIDASKFDQVFIPEEEIPMPNIQEDSLRTLLSKVGSNDKAKDIFIEKRRRKRSEGDLYAVEVAIVIDPPLWKKYHATAVWTPLMDEETGAEYYIRERFANVINGVSLRYEYIEDVDLNVYVTISEFLLYKSDPLMDPESLGIQVVNGVEYADSGDYIYHLPKWASSAPITNNNDHIMIITGYDLYNYEPAKNHIKGTSYVRGACGYYRTSIVEDQDYFKVTSIAAHELGHNLGAIHDGDGSSTCDINDKYIMAPYVTSFGFGDKYVINPWRFSNCSIAAFKEFFASGKCFSDHGDYFDANEWEIHNILQPGERYSVKEQCQLIQGDYSYWCTDASVSDDICRYMACYNPIYDYCNFYAAARGTTCGESMWCVDGQCVEKEARECGDTGGYGMTCQEVSDYYSNESNYGAGFWCYNAYWAISCCKFCSEACFDRGYQIWNCDQLSYFFLVIYYMHPQEWCTDPDWKYRCCGLCTAYGY